MRYLFLALVLAGCSSVTYQTPTGEKFSYSRIGAQSLQGLEVKKDANGVTSVTLKQAKSDAGPLGEALATIAETAVKGAK